MARIATPFRVTETSNLDAADSDGSIRLEPGDLTTVAEYRVQSNLAHLLALGATDADGLTHELHVDNERATSTRSPMGLVNQPYSFIQQLGRVYPAGDLIEYKIGLDDGAEEPQTVAARLFVTEETD